MNISFKDVCTNLKHFDGFDYSNYGISKMESETILKAEEDLEKLFKIRDYVSQTDLEERNTTADYQKFYESIKEIVG